MTVKELIEQLQEFDENLPIFVRTGTLVYEEAEYAEPNLLRKCTYSSRYCVPTAIEDPQKEGDREGIIISLNSNEWVGR